MGFEEKEAKGYRGKPDRYKWATWLIPSQSSGGSRLTSVSHLSIHFSRSKRLERQVRKGSHLHAAWTEVGATLLTAPELSHSGHQLRHVTRGKVPCVAASRAKENLDHRRSHTDLWS